MKNFEINKLDKSLEWLVLFALCLIPIGINPWNNYDSVLLPKYFILVFIVSIAVSVLTLNFTIDFKNSRRLKTQANENSALRIAILFALSFVVLGLSLSLAANHTNYTQQFYGLFGRNTGVITLISLLILFCVSFYCGRNIASSRIRIALLIPGTINVCYGLLQWSNLDPFSAQNLYGPLIGTLGNPNVYSSYLSYVAIFLLSIVANKITASRIRVIALVELLLTCFLLYKNGSLQGPVAASIGGLVFLFWTHLKNIVRFPKSINIISFILLISTFVVVLSGFFGVGLLGVLLKQETLMIRVEFWKAGLSMFFARPWTGFGLDSYGDYYRNYVDERFLESGIFANTSHNFVIDLLSQGGIFLGLGFLIIFVVVFIQSTKVLLNQPHNMAHLALLQSLFVAFLCQSLISFNNIGNSVVGFVIGGLLLGLVAKGSVVNTKAIKVTRSSFATSTVLGIVFFLVTIPPFLSDVKFRNALDSRDVRNIRDSALSWPRNQLYFNVSFQLFRDKGFNDFAMEVALEGLKAFPRNIYLVRGLLGMEDLNAELRTKLENIQKDLDPSKR